MQYTTHTIQVFEHELLKVDTNNGFSQVHWEKLGWYNEEHGGRYFSLVPRGVKFKNYVGVIQVDDLTIEILPKIGRLAYGDDKSRWQGLLLDMLQECNWMNVYANEKATLRYKPRSILEAYLEIFIQECENIIRQGLIKKYRITEGNRNALKGRLMFSKQIQHNSVHSERFYTKHQAFDQENFFNKVLLKTLKIIPLINNSPTLKDRVYRLLLDFPELEDIKVEAGMFDNIQYNRKTLRYAEAIEIAAMILLHYRPDIRSGQKHILALLFDMNELWEEYIFRQIRKWKKTHWNVVRRKKIFWQLQGSSSYKVIKPDIVITDRQNDQSIIIDTKWKLPEDNTPNDADLKQMYVYNEYWNGLASILLYPSLVHTAAPVYTKGSFVRDSLVMGDCGVMKISVLNQEYCGLDKYIGEKINRFCSGLFNEITINVE
ncbi:MAG: restriction endonuclease [Bacteroidia bacterium]|nr:MAG: restriction endonuclease [Bacteroidia bacterium]